MNYVYKKRRGRNMEKDAMKELLGYIRYQYSTTKEFEEELKKRENEVWEKYRFSVNINLHAPLNNDLWSRKEKLNMLFKNDIDDLHYNARARNAGYYLMIHGFFEDKMKAYVSQGLYFFDGEPKEKKNGFVQNSVKYWEKNEDLLDMLDQFLYEKTGIGDLKFENIEFVPEGRYFEFDIDKVSEDDLVNLLKSLRMRLEQYPKVMRVFMQENPEATKKIIEYEKLVGTKEKLFASFNRIFLFTKNIIPKDFESVMRNQAIGDNTKITNVNENNMTNGNVIENENGKEGAEDEESLEGMKKIQDIQNLSEQVKAHKGMSIIYYGIPGSGKSYHIENNILKDVPQQNFERVTFYPEYTYFDFVGQKLPKDDGTGLEFEPGPFTRILEKALNDGQIIKDEKQRESACSWNPMMQYYLVIEEMNRGNAQAIFGDIFQLLDRDEEGNSIYLVTNADVARYLRKKGINIQGDKIWIPSNLSIIATINTSDQNVFNLDTAFGRRWQYEIFGEEQANKGDNLYKNGKVIGIQGLTWNEIRKKINDIILSSDDVFNAEDKRMGLYYIDRECLEENIQDKKEVVDVTENRLNHMVEENGLEENTVLDIKEKSDRDNGVSVGMESRRKFANKIFRYLWTDVFKNCREVIFNTEKYHTLEDIVNDFAKGHVTLDKIIKIKVEEADV